MWWSLGRPCGRGVHLYAIVLLCCTSFAPLSALQASGEGEVSGYVGALDVYWGGGGRGVFVEGSVCDLPLLRFLPCRRLVKGRCQDTLGLWTYTAGGVGVGVLWRGESVTFLCSFFFPTGVW